MEHYKQSYTQLYKYFAPKMPVEDIDESTYKNYVFHLKSALNNDTSINSYYSLQ
ncbi:MAG: phage integrase SAM-like domain-containing protein [Clostridia bacterium]|nr:phage integrase SAM-like domain-containing protein [Clostridia bacterium]